MPVTKVGSRWSSGDLIFYEKDVSLAAIGNILTIGDDAVTVGSTTNNIDFKWYGAGSVSFILDVGDSSMTLTGCNVSIDGDIEITTDDIALDQGYYIYFDGLGNATEYIRSDTANDLMLNATSNLNLAIGGTDEISINNTTVTIVSNIFSVDSTTDTTSTTTGSIHTDGGIGVAKRIWVGTGLIMATGEIDMTTAASGSYGLRLRPNVADALSITRGATDMVVFDSSTPRITITPATTITGALTLSSSLSVDDTTDTSSTVTGSIHTDGGVGIAKQIWLGTNLVMVGGDIDLSTGASGTYDIVLRDGRDDALSIRRASTDMIVFDSATPRITITPATTITGALTLSSTLTVAGILSVDSTTDTTDTITGSIHTDGGLGVAKKVWIGTGLLMATGEIDMTTAGSGSYGLRLKDSVADALSITRGATDMVVFDSSTPSITITPATTITGNLTLSSNLSVDGTTDTSSTTTGSVHTDGGLGVAKKIWLGTDLVMDGGDIDMSSGGTGTYDILLKNNATDALSIKHAGIDMVVFKTSTGATRVTFTPEVAMSNGLIIANGLTVSSGTVSLPAGQIGGTEIADNSIAPGHLRSDLGVDFDGAITNLTIVNGMVTAAS